MKKFDGRTVLSGVDLDIFPGETVVIMGGAGCGKSTFLRCLIGSHKIDEGKIFMFGRDLAIHADIRDAVLALDLAL